MAEVSRDRAVGTWRAEGGDSDSEAKIQSLIDLKANPV